MRHGAPCGKGSGKFPGHIVHTAHVNSLSCSYGGHGSTPHFPNTEVSKAFPEWLLLWSTFAPVASLSTQIYSCLVPFELSVMRYPWYSRVHCPVGHTLRAGIIIRDPRFSALHTAHGTPRKLICGPWPILAKRSSTWPYSTPKRDALEWYPCVTGLLYSGFRGKQI